MCQIVLHIPEYMLQNQNSLETAQMQTWGKSIHRELWNMQDYSRMMERLMTEADCLTWPNMKLNAEEEFKFLLHVLINEGAIL